MTGTTRVWVIEDEDGEPSWMAETENDPATASPDVCVVDVPTAVWERFDEGRRAINKAIAEALTIAGRDPETGELPPCDRYHGEPQRIAAHLNAVAKIDGREYHFARSSGLDGDETAIHQHAARLRSAIANRSLAMLGFGVKDLIELDPDRDTITVTDVPESEHFPWSCRRCGRTQSEHLRRDAETDTPTEPVHTVHENQGVLE
ncbi:MAG: hypothetical protein AAF567_24335 [Actinomycetota bacterium]